MRSVVANTSEWRQLQNVARTPFYNVTVAWSGIRDTDWSCSLSTCQHCFVSTTTTTLLISISSFSVVVSHETQRIVHSKTLMPTESYVSSTEQPKGQLSAKLAYLFSASNSEIIVCTKLKTCSSRNYDTSHYIRDCVDCSLKVDLYDR